MGVTPSRHIDRRAGRTNPSSRSNAEASTELAHTGRWHFYEYPLHEREGDDLGENKPNEQPEPEVTPEVTPEEPQPTDVKPKEALTVRYVDFMRQANEKPHQTTQYDPEEGRSHMIIRRGQTFDITLEVDRPYVADHDEVRIIFEIENYLSEGPLPKPNNGTQMTLHMKRGLQARKWSCAHVSHTDTQVVVRCQAATDAIIGKWSLVAQTSLFKPPEGTEKTFTRFKHFAKVYMLFNPFNKDDETFIEDEVERDEYVLAETGRIFVGNSRQPWGRPWNFGQFEEDILDTAMLLLDMSGISYKVRGSPVYVARALSATANQADENGVLVGNWSGDYEGGVSPTSWAGSIKILQQFYKTREPVQFGQCWVFSGILTSLSRALGLPTRSVTNFSSAHDTDESCTIDIFWTDDGEKDEWRNSDSVWNFHVWNEAWMKRPDLPSGYDGWQAFDATPQESSDGVYQAGPAPCKAIKEGIIDVRYDTPFIFSEVNADRVNWKMVDGEFMVTTVEKSRIGLKISTNLPRKLKRAPNPYAPSYEKHRLDVTNHYKHKEGSVEERAAVYRAHSRAVAPREGAYDSNTKDVAFDVIITDNILVGSNFDVVLKLQNKSRDQRQVRLTLSLNSVYYTGVKKDFIKSKKFDINLAPIKADEAVMRITYEEYMYKIAESATFVITVDAVVEQTFQNYSTQEEFRLRRPDLEIIGPTESKVGKEFELTVKFASSLSIPLTECVWEVEAPGITKPLEIKEKDCEPYDRRELKLKLTGRKAGPRAVVVTFTSKELTDCVGEHDILIQ